VGQLSRIVFHSPRVVEVNGKTVSAPAPFPLGDCRGCILIGFVCEDSYDYPCRGAQYFYERDTGRRLSIEDLEDGDLVDGVMWYKPCCWECPFLMDCMEDFREAGGEEYIEERYGVPWGKFIDVIEWIQRNIVHEG
jgi:hypothetical protein